MIINKLLTIVLVGIMVCNFSAFSSSNKQHYDDSDDGTQNPILKIYHEEVEGYNNDKAALSPSEFLKKYEKDLFNYACKILEPKDYSMHYKNVYDLFYNSYDRESAIEYMRSAMLETENLNSIIKININSAIRDLLSSDNDEIKNQVDTVIYKAIVEIAGD